MQYPGNTPLLRYTLGDIGDNHIYIKDESQNPTGSIKDRAVFQMLIDAKEQGKLVDHPTIIEATSGNTGISLGFYQKDFDYDAIIVMPTSVSLGRRRLIEQYGAKLVLVDGGMKECKEKAEALLQEIPNSFLLDQFNNLSNPRAHYLHTAREIQLDCPPITHVFVGIGTGGTITGIGKFFEKRVVDVIGIEPKESPLLTQGVAGPHLIQGLGANFIPSILDRELIKDIVDVAGEDAIKMARYLNKHGFHNGISSGAAMAGCLSYLKENDIHKAVAVVVFPDSEDRYEW